jgi:hypothetical protein
MFLPNNRKSLMTLKPKKPARLSSKMIRPLALPSKQRTRPPIKSKHPDADPLGLFPALFEQLEQAYHEQVRALLRKFDLIKFEPGVRQRIRAAETASGGPVTFLVALTVHPRDASGFPRLVGKLAPPFQQPQPEQPPDAAEEEEYIDTIFGEKIPASRLKPGRRSRGRR